MENPIEKDEKSSEQGTETTQGSAAAPLVGLAVALVVVIVLGWLSS